ncbi:MAG TPA: hypothetical protein VF478_12625 [Anaerolineae bacterium]
MPSKLSIHLSSYPSKAFDILEKMQPSVVKVFNQNSEINIDEIRRRCGARIIYREYVDLDYHQSADEFYFKMQPTVDKLRGRGIIWEGVNEPVPDSTQDAKLLNAWYVRFAQIMHSEGEIVAGFSWSTGNPTPDKWDSIVPYLVDAAAAVDVHAFHEYYNLTIGGQDWGRYRHFEEAMPANARKPVVITEAGFDESGQAQGGYIGKITNDEYLNVLKQYDQVLLQDPYVLGATIYQWGDGNWPSFDLGPVINQLSDYVVSVGQGYQIPNPWPVPVFGPVRTFTAVPGTIDKGQSSTLQWRADSARTVTLNGSAVSATGSKVVQPTQTTTYTLHIVGLDGSTQDLTATVTVLVSVLPIVLQASLTPAALQVGQTLNVSVTIKNNGTSPLVTQGPNPGFVYDEGDTFYSRGFPGVASAFRFGVDFGTHSGIDHPYRWGLGAPLGPGQTTTVTGSIRLNTPQAVKYWVGLVREQVAWLQDNLGVQTITVTPALPAGTIQITNVTLTPTTMTAGQLLNVSFTIQNNTNETIPTEGPDPGFVYTEGDTFYTRGYPDQRGALRVGIDFDGRSGVDHPYRWGLGAPLAPGQGVTVTGAIRLKTPRAIRYWAGLVREQIKWLQDNQGTQTITVNPAQNAVQIVDIAFTPATVQAGQLLNVAITVFNNTNQTVATQGPNPGFAFLEGDTFYTRGFPDVQGAIRVGVDFDGRTGVDHPYRWGLGAPLAPDQFATIAGTIQLNTPQAINYWAGLVREQVQWMQDHLGTRLVNVTS